jgi:hypothetical protein
MGLFFHGRVHSAGPSNMSFDELWQGLEEPPGLTGTVSISARFESGHDSVVPNGFAVSHPSTIHDETVDGWGTSACDAG